MTTNKQPSEIEPLALKWARAHLRYVEWLLNPRECDLEKGAELSTLRSKAETKLLAGCVRELAKQGKKRAAK